MIETAIVVVIVGVLAGIALAPLPWVFGSAAGLLAVGLALGVPAGVGYHVALFRALRARAPLPARWWLQPAALHGRLLPGERGPVLRWFYAGAIGFLISALGCVILAGAALRLSLGGRG